MHERLPFEKVPSAPTGAGQEKLASSSAGHPLLQLQRTVGNQSVLRRLRLLQVRFRLADLLVQFRRFDFSQRLPGSNPVTDVHHPSL